LYVACSSTVIPKSVIKIGDNSFNYCERISTITIPGNVAEIGHQAFYGCNNLKDVVFQEGVREIGHYAFMEVNSLKTITLPSSLRTIGEGAFERCDIDTIFIPEGVEVILGNPFKGNNPKHIFVSDGNRYYDSRNSCNAIIQSHNNVLITGSCSTVIPSSVTMIGESAFDGCSSLTTLTFGQNSQCTSIGKLAFRDCSGLGHIYLPSSLQSIGNSGFKNCSELLYITCSATTAPTLYGSTVFSGVGSASSSFTKGTLTYPNGSDYSTWYAQLPDKFNPNPGPGGGGEDDFE
jgi:hypothetical protein